MNGYHALALVYDICNERAGYEKLSAFICEHLSQYKENNIVLDAGCGTGAMSLLLSKKGFDVIGVDISPEMLSQAQQKAYDANQNILFLLQDLSSLDLYGTVGGIVCLRDTLNHLEPAKLQKALERFALFLEPGGILIFDINTEYKHRNVLAGNTFVYENSDSMVVWRNAYDEKHSRVELIVDVFCKNEDGSYNRSCDDFFEYNIDEKQLTDMLKSCNMELVEVLDGDKMGPRVDNSERLLFVFRKALTK